ncbi:MAG: ABC transporter permease [Chloroflexota bacterium]
MPFVELFKANIRTLLRNRQALFWSMAFPLIFVFVFGLFFGGDVQRTTLLVIDRADDPISHGLVAQLEALDSFSVETRGDEAAARQEVRDGDAGYLLIFPEGMSSIVSAGGTARPVLVYDQGNASAPIVIGAVGRMLDAINLQASGSAQLLALHAEGVQGQDLSYFDFLLPGFVSMGIMTYSIIGIASVMALYREQKVLKRLLASPLRVRHFFAAIVLAHLLLSLVQAVVIAGVGMLVFDAQVRGNVAMLFLVVLLGNTVFLSIGFIIGALSRTVQAASGLGNAVAMPMMFLSGTFFPRDTLPSVLKALVDFLPLSAMVDLLRGMALDARPLWDFPELLALLLAWAVGSALVAVRVFRFS